MTGQFGKNHLGDLDEHLPTAHGFDEFFGSLYHLNASDEPETPRLPEGPRVPEAIRAARRPAHLCRRPHRGHRAAHQEADGDHRPGGDRRCNRLPEDGPRTQDKPFFLWWNSTRMHVWTRLKAESEGKTGLGIYPDGMVEHDEMVGQMLKALDDLGLAENTIVMYSTDNGAEKFTWPDGGTVTVPRREEHQLGRRLSSPVRGALARRHQARHDLQRDRRARGLDTDACGGGRRSGHQGEAADGHKVGDKTFKVHLDGYNVTDYLAGTGERSAQGVHLLRR